MAKRRAYSDDGLGPTMERLMTETGLTYFLYKQYYPESSADTYKDFARYFYGVQDKTNFVTVMKRLSVITHADKDKNAKLIELANNGSWSDITIE